MSARFRIRTAQGQELSFGSEEMFADFVKSGDLSPDDLVYDATTGEWCSAFTHTLVLEWQAEREASEGDAPPPGTDPSSNPSADAPAESMGSGGGDASDETPPSAATPGAEGSGSLMDFELSPERTPEEAAAAFVEEMEAERASELDRFDTVRGLEIDEGGTGLLKGVSRTEPPSGPPAPGGAPRDEPRRESSGAPELARVRPSQSTSSPRKDAPARTSRAGRGASRSFIVWAVTLGVVGAGVLLGSDIAAVALGISAPESTSEVEGPPILPDTEEALRGRASVRFLARVRQELGTLPNIPSIWLDGRYLADASQYPAVRDTWNRYLERVEAVQADEAQHYRTAYLSALDDARVTGATRTLRLASAASAFDAAAPERETHYDRLEELASSALDLHDFLVEHEAEISYEPAVGTRVSADPVLQAAASDPGIQAELETALDRVLEALSARGMGPVDARAVSPWAFQGLRDIVAP